MPDYRPGVGGVGSDIDTCISCIKIQHGVQSEKEPLVYRLQYQETNSILKILCSSCLRVRGGCISRPSTIRVLALIGHPL